jgi:hypothetical protein
LTGIPKPIVRTPANKKPIPAINSKTIIRTHPGLRSKRPQRCQRHDTVIFRAWPTGNSGSVPQAIGPAQQYHPGP